MTSTATSVCVFSLSLKKTKYLEHILNHCGKLLKYELAQLSNIAKKFNIPLNLFLGKANKYVDFRKHEQQGGTIRYTETFVTA